MRILKFFFHLQSSHMSLAILAGILSGVGNVLFIAVVNTAIHPRAGALGVRASFLISLCCVVVLFRFMSDVILIRLSERIVFELRLRLSRAILMVPLRRTEILGNHALFATLTEDVGRLAELALNIPNVCVNGAIVIAGIGYLFYLSPRVMLTVVGVISLGVVVYSYIRIQAVEHFQRARERQGELMKHFRALTDGMKDNLSEAEMKAFEPRIKQLLAAMNSMQEAKKGMRITLDWLSAVGTTVTVDGRASGLPILGDDFYRALLKIWLGDKPVQPDLKNALLGGKQ